MFSTVFSDFKNILLYAVGLTCAYALVGKAIFWEFGLKFVSFQGMSLENFTTKIVTENSHHVLLFLVSWFLVALFFARALAILLIDGVNRLVPVRLSGPLLLLAAGLLCYVGMDRLAPAFHATRNPWLNFGAQVAVAAGFILLGREALANRLVLTLLRHPLAGFVLATALYEGVVLGGVTPLSMAWSEYPAGFSRHMLGALLGILLVLTIAFTIARVRPDSLLASIGQRSKAVMSHHLFTFLLINLTLAGFGVLVLQDIGIWTSYATPVTWPLYVGLGVGVPILIDEIGRRATAALRLRWRQREGKAALPQPVEGG